MISVSQLVNASKLVDMTIVSRDTHMTLLQVHFVMAWNVSSRTWFEIHQWIQEEKVDCTIMTPCFKHTPTYTPDPTLHPYLLFDNRLTLCICWLGVHGMNWITCEDLNVPESCMWMQWTITWLSVDFRDGELLFSHANKGFNDREAIWMYPDMVMYVYVYP